MTTRLLPQTEPYKYMYKASQLVQNPNFSQLAHWAKEKANQKPKKRHPQPKKSIVLEMNVLKPLVDEKPVVIFSKSSCCVSHSMKQLISSYGANATVYELDELPNGQVIEQALESMGNDPAVPALFIGQEFIGGSNKLLRLLVHGKLVTMHAHWCWSYMGLEW